MGKVRVSARPGWAGEKERAREGSAPPPKAKEWRRGQTADRPVPARNEVGPTYLLHLGKRIGFSSINQEGLTP